MSTKLWSIKPYGKKLALPSRTDSEGRTVERLLIILDPGSNTTMGIDPTTLNKDGLRPHPNELQEDVTLVGYVAPLKVRTQRLGDEPLAYTFDTGGEECDGGEVITDHYGRRFRRHLTSVYPNGAGHWHYLGNDGNLPILLRIEITRPLASV